METQEVYDLEKVPRVYCWDTLLREVNFIRVLQIKTKIANCRTVFTKVRDIEGIQQMLKNVSKVISF
jgi:hypothetical protein